MRLLGECSTYSACLGVSWARRDRRARVAHRGIAAACVACLLAARARRRALEVVATGAAVALEAERARARRLHREAVASRSPAANDLARARATLDGAVVADAHAIAIDHARSRLRAIEGLHLTGERRARDVAREARWARLATPRDEARTRGARAADRWAHATARVGVSVGVSVGLCVRDPAAVARRRISAPSFAADATFGAGTPGLGRPNRGEATRGRDHEDGRKRDDMPPMKRPDSAHGRAPVGHVGMRTDAGYSAVGVAKVPSVDVNFPVASATCSFGGLSLGKCHVPIVPSSASGSG